MLAALPLVRSGKVRPLAMLGDKRSKHMPDVPTVTETLPGFQKLGGGLGFYGPAGLPRPIVQRLNGEVAKSLAAKEVHDVLVGQGFDPEGTTPQKFGEYITSEAERWGPVVKSANMKLD